LNSTRSYRGFTLVELLVVITIVTLLLGMLIPQLTQARLLAQTLKCGAVQHNLYVAMSAYGADNGEYPTNYNRQIPCSANTVDECAGWLQNNAATYTSVVYQTAPFFYPLQGVSPLERLFIGGNLGPRYDNFGNSIWQSNPASQCTATLPKGWYTTGSTFGTIKYFTYNGPQANSANVLNNGGEIGLYYLGRHSQGETWGCSYKYTSTKYRISDIAFLGCPTFINYNSKLVMEPHGMQPTGSYASISVGNGQTDSNASWLAYDRNYTFGDGHTSYIRLPGRANFPTP
jgi:prepilin-type N-terminal cleavage/methylation domain-containing protein